MTVALSSLRVTADMDASGFVRGSQQITSASAAAGDSADALGESLARTDAGLAQVIPGMTSLSKALIDGYSQGAKFYSTLDRIENSLNKGMGADRAEVMIRSLMDRTGQVADATDLWNNKLQMTAQIVDKINSQKFAQNFQQGINNNLGVNPGSGTGSAQASADAFLAQYGGLEGVAQAKAQSIADAFSRELDTRLIAGTGKSARDSASVFQTELDRMDSIASQRATQTGQYFTKDLNDRLVSGTGKSAKDSAAVFQVELDKMDEIAQLKAQQIGQNFQNSLNESFGIGAQSKSAAQSAAVFQQFDQQAKAADDLKAKYVPLYAAQRNFNSAVSDIDQLYKSGKITQDEYFGAVGNSYKSYKDAASAAKELAEGTGAGSAAAAFGNTQFMALTAAVRHMFDSIAAGRPVFQTIASEFGNLSYGLSGSGGFMGALKAIGGGIASYLNPVTVAVGAIAVSFVAATIAAVQYGNAQAAIAQQLAGIGRGSGATVSDINRIGNQNTDNGLSISEATKFASTLAATGKIGVDQIGPLVALGHDLAKTLGTDAAGAAKTLAASFSDPAKGADELNKSLGFMSAGTKELIANMASSGRQFDAQQELLERLKSNLSNATDVTTGWGRAWESVSNTISNAWNKLGQALFGGDTSIQSKLDAAKRQLDGLQAAQDVGGGDFSAAIKSAQAEIDRLTQKLADAAAQSAQVKLNLQSLQIRPQADTFLPEIKQLQSLQNAQVAIGSATEDPLLQKALGLTQAQINEAKARVDGLVATFKTAYEKSVDTARISFDAITAYSPAEKGLIAYRQALDSLQSNGSISPADKEKIAWQAYAQAVQQVTAQLQETGRVRLETATQGTAAAQLDVNLVGKTTEEQARLRGELQNRFTLEKEADANRTTMDVVQLKALNDQVAATTRLKQEEATRAASLKTNFETALQGMGPIAQKIATTIQSVFGNGANQNTPGVSQLSSLVNTQEVLKMAAAFAPASTAAMNAKDAVAAFNKALDDGQVQKYASAIGITLTQALQRVNGMSLAATLNNTDPIQNAITNAEDQIKALDQRSIAARQRQAEDAERRSLAQQAASGQNIGSPQEQEARINLAGKLAAGGQTALDNVQKQRIQTLGQLATVDQQVYSKELDLNNAARDGITFSGKQRQAIIDLAREQAESTKLNEQVSNGIFNMGEQAQNASLHLKNLINDGTIKSAQDYANATNVAAKSIENAKNQAAVAAAPLEGLQKLQNEAGSLRTQLDTFATDSTNNVVTALTAITMHTSSATDAFKNLGLQVLTSLSQMIIKMTIAAPLAAALQSSLGGGLLSLFGGGSTGTFGGTGGALGPLFADGGVFNSSGLIKFASGGIVSSPTVFPFANGVGLMGEAGPEAIMPLSRGPGGSLGIKMHGSGGGQPIVMNNTYNFPGDANPQFEARMRNYVDQSSKNAVSTAVQLVAKTRGNNPGYLPR